MMTRAWLVLLVVTVMCYDRVISSIGTQDVTTVVDIDIVTSPTEDNVGSHMSSVYKVPKRRERQEVTPPPSPSTRWVGDVLHDAVGGFVPQGGSRLCDRHSRLYRQALENLTLWAVQSE